VLAGSWRVITRQRVKTAVAGTLHDRVMISSRPSLLMSWLSALDLPVSSLRSARVRAVVSAAA